MIAIVLEVVGAAVVLELAVQAAWHLGLRRLWKTGPPRCHEIMEFKDSTSSQCKHDLGHDGPHEFRMGGYTYHRELKP